MDAASYFTRECLGGANRLSTALDGLGRDVFGGGVLCDRDLKWSKRSLEVVFGDAGDCGTGDGAWLEKRCATVAPGFHFGAGKPERAKGYSTGYSAFGAGRLQRPVELVGVGVSAMSSLYERRGVAVLLSSTSGCAAVSGLASFQSGVLADPP